MDQKTAVVTGAARGIGLATADLFLEMGWRVVMVDRDAEALEAEAGQRQSVRAVACDVSDPDAVAAMAEAAAGWAGRIDALVNNAGILRDRIWHKMSHEDWQAVIDVHLHGCFNTSKAATPYFKEQGSGALVHFTSTSGLIGNIGQANYSAAKLGIVGLSQSIALDASRYGVRSNCIAPFAWSRMTASIPTSGEGAEERVKRLQSMGAEKIAPLAAYLCSDAAQAVTNQIFAVRRNEIVLFSKPRPVRSFAKDGGWTPQEIADIAMPAFEPDFARGDEVSAHVFPYDPI